MFRRKPTPQPVEATPRRSLTDGDRVILRARALMENGMARSWSHAIAIAAETLPREQGERNA